ncbi:MAG TPA: tyrosine--tRNA ligase [Pseudomonadales bacterium]|jgi:tyrosyl-tRNA synthetase
MGIALIEELNERELIAQVSDMEALRQHLETGSRTLYCGFDPTADSLHIGNLVPLLTLRRFQLGGHRPILLLGGATGLIGDPSGRSDERNLNSGEVVAGWVERIRRQVEGFVDFSGGNGAVIVNNLDWTADLPVIAFLRDVGKHFSVNTMIQRESVKSRLDRDEAGISYTEFSYMLLQAMDYLELAERYGCSLQIGGSDQWGNIVSGMDLVRRKLKKEAFALTLPLVTKADGTKFGKTAAGAVWIDPDRTSPYSFYQFWLNTADADVVRFLQVFTFLPLERIAQLAEAAREAPERREAQQALAEEVTSLVHGDSSLESARRISRCLFQGDIRGLTEADLNQLQQDGIQCTVTKEERPGLLAVLADAGLAPSRSAARKLLQGGGVSVNGVVQEHPEAELDWGQALFGRYFLVRRGKKNWHLLARRKES